MILRGLKQELKGVFSEAPLIWMIFLLFVLFPLILIIISRATSGLS